MHQKWCKIMFFVYGGRFRGSARPENGLQINSGFLLASALRVTRAERRRIYEAERGGTGVVEAV